MAVIKNQSKFTELVFPFSFFFHVNLHIKFGKWHWSLVRIATVSCYDVVGIICGRLHEKNNDRLLILQIFYIFMKLQITINDLTLFWTCWILYEFYDSSHEMTFARNSHKNTHDFLTENTIRPLMYVKDQKIPTKFNNIINLVSVVRILEWISNHF